METALGTQYFLRDALIRSQSFDALSQALTQIWVYLFAINFHCTSVAQ